MSRLLTNSLFNLLGQVLPLVIALVAWPVAIGGLGLELAGILTFAWTLLGYFAFFDLGLGRGTTKFFAEALQRERHDELADILWVSFTLNAAIGFVALVALLAGASALTALMQVPAARADLAATIFAILAFAIPAVTINAVLRGVLEAAERFDIVNLIKVPSNSALFLIPAVCVPLGMDLVPIVALMVASRWLTVLASFWSVARLFPAPVRVFSFRPARAGAMLRYGGWVSVSNLMNPLVTYGERFLIPGMLSLTMLTYYTAPYELVARMAIIPASISLTLFPRFSSGSLAGERDARALVVRPSIYIVLVMTPLALGLLAFAPEILRIWLGGDFAEVTGTMLMVLAVSFFFNALAYVPLAALQGMGRPEVKAWLDIIAAAVFGVLCWGGITLFGITGAAWAKLAVTLLDAVVLLVFALHLLRMPARFLFVDGMGALLALSLVLLALSFAGTLLALPVAARAALFASSLAVHALHFWNRTASDDDRLRIRSVVARWRSA